MKAIHHTIRRLSVTSLLGCVLFSLAGTESNSATSSTSSKKHPFTDFKSKTSGIYTLQQGPISISGPFTLSLKPKRKGKQLKCLFNGVLNNTGVLQAASDTILAKRKTCLLSNALPGLTGSPPFPSSTGSSSVNRKKKRLKMSTVWNYIAFPGIPINTNIVITVKKKKTLMNLILFGPGLPTLIGTYIGK